MDACNFYFLTSYYHVTLLTDIFIFALHLFPSANRYHVFFTILASFIQIYARGILLKTVTSRLVHTKHSSINFEVTGDMVPHVYVVATHVTNTGVLLTDYISLRVSGSPCKNKVRYLNYL